jgi:hypothetical protein
MRAYIPLQPGESPEENVFRCLGGLLGALDIIVRTTSNGPKSL